MMKQKTMILYAATASLGLLAAEVATARQRGQPVRLIALEEFRGETEQNAGAVYVERAEGDELLFDRIQQAYPAIVVADWSGRVDLDDHQSFQPEQAEDTLRALRLELIGIGGSAPAGADAAQLADLIAAQRAALRHTPILPNAATQGTTVPDPQPIVQKTGSEQLVDAAATGSTAPVIRAAVEASGGDAAAVQADQSGTRTDSTTLPAGDVFDAKAFVGRNVGDVTDTQLAELTNDQRAAAVEAEKAGQARPTLLKRLGVDG